MGRTRSHVLLPFWNKHWGFVVWAASSRKDGIPDSCTTIERGDWPKAQCWIPLGETTSFVIYLGSRVDLLSFKT